MIHTLSTERAFTLIEFAIVVLIAALVIGTVTPVYLHIIDEKKTDYAVDEITRMQRDIDRFSKKNGRYPDTLAEIFTTVPLDPWGTPYRYLKLKGPSPGQGNPRVNNTMARINSDYDLYSDGPDQASLSPVSASESRDDVIRARNGNYIGVAAELR
jgi:general secretion pathway protein G